VVSTCASLAHFGSRPMLEQIESSRSWRQLVSGGKDSVWQAPIILTASAAAAFSTVVAVADVGSSSMEITPSFIYGVVALVSVVATVVATMSWVDKRISKLVTDHERYETKVFEDRFHSHEEWANMKVKETEREIRYLRSRLNKLYDALAATKMRGMIGDISAEEEQDRNGD
jgi:precorrin-2 methylase